VRVLVTGATGFIGGHVARRLVDTGHDVAALSRHPERYRGAGVAVGGDVRDTEQIRSLLDGQDAAYYFVHSLDRADFAPHDRDTAIAFAKAAAAGGVSQVVYLGGLGADDDRLSPHLRSRREVERILLDLAPCTALRAAIVIGDGSVSWEILCQLVERLPVMITPRWVQTRVDPIGLTDAVTYLAAVLGRPDSTGRTYDIGGHEQLTYRRMMEIVATMTARRRLITPVPVLSPRLSSAWLRLVTDVDLRTARALVDSMVNEVVVQDRAIESLTGHVPSPFADAAAEALAARARRRAPGGDDDGRS
jgi:uncharacterized protein YbjT (DUF2867 family)